MKYYNTRFDMINELCSGKRCVEVGVRAGAFSKAIAAQVPLKLYLVDIWRHQDEKTTDGFSYEDHCNKPQQEQDRLFRKVSLIFKGDKKVKIMRMWSGEAADSFPDKFLDWVYIDANHSEEAAYSDMVKYAPKIKSGGWLCGHDYIDDSVDLDGSVIGVKKAVERFMKEKNLKLDFLTTKERAPSWGIKL